MFLVFVKAASQINSEISRTFTYSHLSTTDRGFRSDFDYDSHLSTINCAVNSGSERFNCKYLDEFNLVLRTFCWMNDM